MTTSDFVFDFHAIRPLITDRQMIESLREFGARVGGRAFTMEEYDRWEGKRGAATTIRARFGRWRKALSAAGIERARCARWEPAELMAMLEELWRKLGHRPTHDQLWQAYGITGIPYQVRWGSLRQACERLAKHHAGKLTREALITPEKGRPKRGYMRVGVRWAVLKRDDHRCVLCGATAAGGRRLEVDHIVPVAKGGSDEMGNLRTLCFACNRGKGDE